MQKITSRYQEDSDFRQRQKLYITNRYRQSESFKQKWRSYITNRYRQSESFKQKQRSYITNRYRQSESFKQKQRSYITNRYRQSESFKQKQRSYITNRYRQSESFKQKQRSYITNRYRQSESFKQKQRSYITNRYRQSESFKQKQRSYITNRYRQSESFKQKQRSYITNRYRQSESFKQKRISYITNRYRQSESFKHERRSYITNRYKLNARFRQTQKSYMTNRYANDPAFRSKQNQIMRQQMKNKYQSNRAFGMTHRMNCAINIRQKYRRMQRRQNQRDDSPIGDSMDDSLIRYAMEDMQMQDAIEVFRSNIKKGPTYACTVCHRALFPNQVKCCNRSKYNTNPLVAQTCLTGKYVHVCTDECQNAQQCTVPAERKKEWICHTCHEHLKTGIMPPLAMSNNLELADIPTELCDLNILERHLISKCITFAKIIPLPKGAQRQICGNLVCVPSEVQETVNALPRLRSESQLMRVKLKRKLCYTGHQLFQTVTWTKLVRALLKLKEVHPQYTDITIRDEAELCDPLIDEEANDSDEENMDDTDYNVEDMMEIDSFENDAVFEAEMDSENDEQDTNSQLSDGQQPQQQSENIEPESDKPNGAVALESCLQPTDLTDEILSFSEGIYSVAPAEGNKPVSFFKTPNLEAMAFPVQFPTGKNTLDENRHKKLTPCSYFKTRLCCVDDRFARDTNYLFFAQFVSEIYQATCSMSIQLRKAKPFTRDGREITNAMLQNKHEVEKLVRNKDAIRFMTPLRGSPAF